MRVRRPWMSCRERNELWERWRRGESLTDIARALQRTVGRVHTIVATEGGIVPSPRRRARWALRATEREEISRGLAEGLSVRGLAARLRRAPSTISREIRRHGGRQRYRAQTADRRAWARSASARPTQPASTSTEASSAPSWST